MRKAYCVTLTVEERGSLLDLISAGRESARTLAHARILLKADQGVAGSCWTDVAIAEALEISLSTIERVRKRCVREGVAAALRRRRARRHRPRTLDGRQEAHLIALACGAPPAGKRRWSLRLLADRFVALEDGATVSYQVVRRTLKKTHSNRGCGSNGASRRRRAASSSGAWRTCSRSTTDRTTPASRRSAWMRPASNCWPMPIRRWAPPRGGRRASTTSIAVAGRRTCSSPASRCGAGATSPS